MKLNNVLFKDKCDKNINKKAKDDIFKIRDIITSVQGGQLSGIWDPNEGSIRWGELWTYSNVVVLELSICPQGLFNAS